MESYFVLKQQQNPFVGDQLDFLLEALHACRLIAEGDLGEAGAVKISGVVHPGLC